MIPIDLDINMLRCFTEVAETGSFTIAGNNIGLTQAGVSTKIRRLEERLDAKVFNRGTKELTLTYEGEVLLEHAKRILKAHDDAVSQLTEPRISGTLRVGLIDYFLPELLPGILNQFTKDYPDVNLEVQTEVGTGLIPAFEKGELDIVVAGKDAYQGKCRILMEEPLTWMVKKAPVPLPDAPIPLVLFPSPCHFRKPAIEHLEKAGRKWKIVFTGTSTTSIQTAVTAGIGICVLPNGALASGMETAPPEMDLPRLPPFNISLFMDDTKKNPARDAFVSYLEAELDKHKRVPA